MKIYRICCLFIFWQIQCFAQHNCKITGQVIDVDSKEPIPYVYVRVLETELYFITDSSGSFKFNCPNSKTEFSFEHLNYKKSAISIDTLANTSTGLKLVFKLKRKENTLEEVVISAKTEITNPICNIIDFDFIDNNIVVLNYKVPPYKSEIIILNEQLDTLSIGKLHFEPESLFKDCFGNIQVLSSDSSYQLFYQSTSLFVYPPYSLSEFKEKLGNCYTATQDFIYFIQKSGSIMITNTIFHDFPSKNNALSYFYIDKNSRKRAALFNVVDKRHEEARKEDSDAEKRAMDMKVNYKSNTIFRETILLDEIYAPLFVVNDSIVVFDFIHDEVNFFKGNTSISKKQIKFHRTKAWKRLILFDAIQKKTYAKYMENDKLTIKEINYRNGKIGNSFVLPNACLKLKIMNGNAYYLFRSSINNSLNLALNRVFLK